MLLALWRIPFNANYLTIIVRLTHWKNIVLKAFHNFFTIGIIAQDVLQFVSR